MMFSIGGEYDRDAALLDDVDELRELTVEELNALSEQVLTPIDPHPSSYY
jgi:hypothetical protein